MANTIIYIITAMWVMVAIQIVFEYRHHKGNIGPYMGISKTIGSILFVAAAFAGTVQLQIGGWLLLGGLILCVVGDVFLISPKRLYFLLGISAFLLAHFFYCSAFVVALMAKKGNPFHAFGAIPIVAFVGFGVVHWLWPHTDKKMKPPVLAYIITICIMVALSGAFISTQSLHFTVAAVLFMLSDILVARDRFVQSTFVNRLLGLPLYYAAQIIFAASYLIGEAFSGKF